MTPAQEFRLWARRAPTAERISAGVATVVVLALLVWLVAPGSGTTSTKLASGGGGANGGGVLGELGGPAGSVPGQAGAGGSAAGTVTGPGGASGPGGAAAGAKGSATAAGGTLPAGCPATPSGVTGVTATQIKIAVTLTEIIGPAANSTFGIAPPDEQRSWYEAILDDMNKSGGVGCRKVVAQYFKANPSDQNGLNQTCLDIAQAGVFAEIDNGSYANYPQKQCFAQHHIPFFGSYLLYRSEETAFYPYLFNMVEYETLEHNTIFALHDRGFFNVPAGQKVGWFYENCDKTLIDRTKAWFQQIGVNPVTYEVSCPSVFASPSDIQAAILKFRQNNVTRVTMTRYVGDFANFTNVAQQQGFNPQYGIPDEDMIDISYGNLKPNYANVANAIVITSARSGEERTPGMAPTPGTQKCDAIYAAHGIKPTYKLPGGAGYSCNQMWMFQAAVNRAPALNPAALAAGLQAIRSLDLSYPSGPTDYTGAKVTTGGQFWRVGQFLPSCSCWQVVDPTFHPSYP